MENFAGSVQNGKNEYDRGPQPFWVGGPEGMGGGDALTRSCAHVNGAA